ncbi:PaaI family thioesterase [Nocardia otitidiscaviarum]|uniref:Acyl-coenzyme A thioesterase THEM4 n=1 Tax=Nocardia otitidiscaviarum TaxID=1823 RepID=A0A516NER0_9NOCA|nr:PaaI family thioesterase [Nocardia otitidiscaviarum]MBF6183035.1 PaaI family thioesterase [Nocardia otitidiscaviarum]MCP9622642.1 PaaI family thioesterase [Nocardia otitidiscaviarum]QDP77390.1 PaaI family thioesterase [Nocardia otitidiscaviarum]
MSERPKPVIDASAVDHDRYERHGGFPKIVEAHPGPEFGSFVAAMRTLQDLAVSVDAPDEVYGRALRQAHELIELLEPYRAPELASPAGRATALPGRGSLLMPPWRVVEAGPDGVRSQGEFRRYHVGGNSAVHGGVLPLLFDDLFGTLVHYAGRPISRTAFLHVNYRKITPVETPLTVVGTVDRVEGRKTFVSARLLDESETLLADCEGLMVQLLPWQP